MFVFALFKSNRVIHQKRKLKYKRNPWMQFISPTQDNNSTFSQFICTTWLWFEASSDCYVFMFCTYVHIQRDPFCVDTLLKKLKHFRVPAFGWIVNVKFWITINKWRNTLNMSSTSLTFKWTKSSQKELNWQKLPKECNKQMKRNEQINFFDKLKFV